MGKVPPLQLSFASGFVYLAYFVNTVSQMLTYNMVAGGKEYLVQFIVWYVVPTNMRIASGCITRIRAVTVRRCLHS